VEHVTRDTCVERPFERGVEHGGLLEPRASAVPKAAPAGPGKHLGREIDTDHPAAGIEKRLADESGPATGIEQESSLRKVRESNELP
jgi:hypothetical protein